MEVLKFCIRSVLSRCYNHSNEVGREPTENKKMTNPVSEETLLQLGEYATTTLAGDGALLLGVPVATELGGFEKVTYRLDLDCEMEGEILSCSLVVKAAREAEIRILRQLRPEGLQVIPQYLGSIVTGGKEYVLTPFYDGRTLGFGDVMPKPVLSMLARIHTAFEENYQQLDYLPVADEAYLTGLIETALKSVRSFPKAMQIMKDIRSNADLLYSMLLENPMTLLQGDVHPGNIIQLSGSAVLVDWGNARIGPRTLDLANITSTQDDAWMFYLSESERFGTKLGADRMLRNHVWASALVILMYLPYGTQSAGGEDLAENMTARLLRIIQQL